RGLDFKKLVILSVNEGILPSKPSVNSFIPYNLRKAFKLPTQEDKDAIYAYHFYRLIQRASDITLIYNTENDSFGSGEKSRFISQLETELPARNPDLQLIQETLTFPSAKVPLIPVAVPKTQELLDKLQLFATEKGFAPSTLSTYLNCSLQFYLKHILRLYEKDEPEETMEDNTFGTVLHGVMEKLYEPFVGKMVQVSDIEAMDAQVKPIVEEVFRAVTRTENFRFGKNHLLLGVIRNLVKLVLDLDRADAPFAMQGLEMEIETQLKTLRQPAGVKLRGYLDRVDLVDGLARIIDYKTGKERRVELKDFAEIRDGTEKREAFQLSFYSYLYLRNQEKDAEVRTGIYFMRNLSKGLQFLTIGPTKANELDLRSLEDFEAELVMLLDEIFDKETPFSQTEEADRCRFCSYKVICTRS
ncbi:MAG TPA: PD-(D/E)XK nuclease family protein, partial [Bacteroidetes bacterium]|nr:PD-(D/E)XK nuclease family protein [Bacteroidota bacterium]